MVGYRPDKRGKYEVELRCEKCGHTWIMDWELHRAWNKTYSANGFKHLLCPVCGEWVTETNPETGYVHAFYTPENPDIMIG